MRAHSMRAHSMQNTHHLLLWVLTVQGVAMSRSHGRWGPATGHLTAGSDPELVHARSCQHGQQKIGRTAGKPKHVPSSLQELYLARSEL